MEKQEKGSHFNSLAIGLCLMVSLNFLSFNAFGVYTMSSEMARVRQASPSFENLPPENQARSNVLQSLEKTTWKGRFHVRAELAGRSVQCTGPVMAEFFESQNGESIAYANLADFSKATGHPLLCKIASLVSPVKYKEQCKKDFPRRKGQLGVVPVRTIEESDAVSGFSLKTPKCDTQTGKTEHSVAPIESFERDGSQLKIRIYRKFIEGFGEIDIRYTLKKQ